MKPKARKEQLRIEPLKDETVVVDLKRNKTHCLNKVATSVWGYCDGKTTVGEMADRLHRDVGLPRRQSVVLFAIQQLKRAELLEAESIDQSPAKLLTRREVGRSLSAQAALLVPLVTSIAVPTAAMASSRQRRPRRRRRPPRRRR